HLRWLSNSSCTCGPNLKSQWNEKLNAAPERVLGVHFHTSGKRCYATVKLQQVLRFVCLDLNRCRRICPTIERSDLTPADFSTNNENECFAGSHHLGLGATGVAALH